MKTTAALVAACFVAGCAASSQPAQRWQGIGLSAKQEGVCAGIENAGQCARAMEAQKWSKLDRFARRDGRVLELALADGKTRRFEDAPGKSGPDAAVQYSLLEFVRQADSFVVFELAYEGSNHLLVRRSDGGVSKLDSAPVFSPDSSHFVTASASGTHNPTAIRVYRTAGPAGKPKIEWSLEPGTWGPGLPRWIDDDTIQIPTDGVPPDASKGEKVPSELTVKRSAGAPWYAVLSFDKVATASN